MPSHEQAPPRDAADLIALAPALDEGRGTAYERYALDRFLEQLARRLPIRNTLELPANGVMGVPGIKSLALACSGVEVTLAVPAESTAEEVRSLWTEIGLSTRIDVRPYDTSGYPQETFDLVWSFCVIEHVADPAALVREMVRVSRGFFLIFTQNPYNPGIGMHRLLHAMRREAWDHGDLARAPLAKIMVWLRQLGATVLEVGGVDCPPWPDINMQLAPDADTRPEQSPPEVARFRPSVRRRSVAEINRRIRRTRAAGDAADGFWPQLYREWNRLEQRLPRTFLRYGAHHPYILARVNRPA